MLQQSPSHISCDHTRLRSTVFHAGFVSDLHPPKKWSWMKDLRISCLKFWFQKWHRLKTLGEFTMAAMEKKSFYAGNGNPTTTTNIPHTWCLYSYIQHGPFCIIWLSLFLKKHTWHVDKSNLPHFSLALHPGMSQKDAHFLASWNAVPVFTGVNGVFCLRGRGSPAFKHLN